MTLHALIQMLLHLYYANASGIRSQLIGFYRRELPGMPAGWYRGYVRFLIYHYPRVMRHCVDALHARNAGAARYWCSVG